MLGEVFSLANAHYTLLNVRLVMFNSEEFFLWR